MNQGSVLLVSFGIGFVAGLRSMMAPAVVAWAAHLRWIKLTGTSLGFMGTAWAVGIFTLAAIGELINDKLPRTPARTAAVGLVARLITGALMGACLAIAGGASVWLGAVFGSAGSIVGAFGGQRARVGVVRAIGGNDFPIAVVEDLVAIAVGLFLVRRF
jgi:uncharacterized membrane protein